jgi:hypothetical protein
MRFRMRPVMVALTAGTLAFLCYELWYLAQVWTKGTFLADFPLLVGFGAIIAFLTLAEIVLNLVRRLFSRSSSALH